MDGLDFMPRAGVSVDVLAICVKARESAKQILLANYAASVAPFIGAIQTVQSRRHCSVADAALVVSNELRKTGHSTLLVFAAVADLLESVA